MKVVLLAAISFVFAIGPARVDVQQKAVDLASHPIRKLDFLVGEWEGSGWIQLGPTQRRTYRQHESIRYAAGGTVLVVEGLGRNSDAGPDQGKVVHDAFAVASFDRAKKAYLWRAFTANDDAVDTVLDIDEAEIRWGIETPQGKTRFRLRIDRSGEWIESGEFSPDGKSWSQFLEMKLKKKAN